MHTLIDGYNVTKGDPATQGMPLEEQRTALVRRLRARRDTLLGGGAVTIVFDGQPGVVGSVDSGAIDVRFSGGESADEVLVRMAARLGEPISLVTSDRELRERVSSVSTVAVSYRDRSELYESAKPRRGRKRSARASIDSDAGLPQGANKITQELKDLWLDGEPPAE
jgi:predicted RNA-binding protein with PIN domain